MKVSKIEFRIELDDGRTADVVFVRAKKIASLMQDRGNLGEFLRDIVKSMPAKKGGQS